MSDIESGSRRPASDPVGRPGEWSPGTLRIALLGDEAEPKADGPLASLDRLGDPVELLQVRDPRSCLALCGRRDLDLVLVDRAPLGRVQELLAGLAGGGPPLVWLVEDGPEADRLAQAGFRAGAADVVRAAGPDDDTLAVVVLEQIRRHRQSAQQGAAERHIAWLERLNDAVVEALPTALAVVDGRRRVIAVNPEFSRVFGVDPEAASGRPIEGLLPGGLAESAELPRLLAEAAAGRPAAPRLGRWTDASGQRCVDLRVRSLDGEGRVLLALSEVSERERLARRVERLRRYSENIIQNLSSALVVVDRAGVVRFANAVARDMLGEDLVGGRLEEGFAETSGEWDLVARTLADGVRFKNVETVLRRVDGRAVAAGLSCSPVDPGDGSGRVAVVLFQDLTELKQLQRQVLQSEKMASIGQLAAGVAHEINNPMGFIHANLFQVSEYLADLRQMWERVGELRESVETGDPEALRRASEALDAVIEERDIDFVMSDLGKAIRESQEGSERIRHIVQDLRDFSYPDTAEQVPADVNQCVDSTASIVWTMMKHSVVLQKDYCDLPPVRCYPMQLKQVFMNLIVNAYQAIDERLGGSGETGEIRIRTEREGDEVVVSVRDTGIGIAEEDLPRLFDPFFTTKEVGAGTGLGLSTSYSIVRRHGGSIRVRSRVGEGSCFEVRLPIGGRPEPGSSEGDDGAEA